MCYCFICGKPSLMGFHPLCMLLSARLGVDGCDRNEEIAFCIWCPFRKDLSNWMDARRILLNKLRLKYDNVQTCHRSDQGDYLCGGAIVCLQGGSETVYTPDELNSLKSNLTDETMGKVYDNRPKEMEELNNVTK